MKKILTFILGIVITITIIFPRFYHLGTQPPGLHIDEVSFAADAKSIAETGRDTWGTSWPVVFKAFGEWKAPGLTYSMAFWTKILGRMDTTVARIPSAIAGLTILVSLYFTLIALLGSKAKYVSLFSVFILAFSPWHFDMSRIFYEAFSALAIFSVSILFITKATLSYNKKLSLWIIAAACAGLAGYWYASIRYVVIVAILVAVLVKEWTIKEKLKSGIFLVMILLAVGVAWVPDLFSDKGLNRYYYYQTKSAQGATLEVDEKRQYCYLSFNQDPSKAKYCYIIWNKPVSKITNIIKTYYTYLGTDFLFIKAISEYGFDSGYGAYLIPILPLYLVGLFLVISGSIRYIGTIFIKKEKASIQDRIYTVYLIILCVSLLPSAVANSINMRMGLIALYFVSIMMGLGANQSVNWIQAHFRKFSWAIYLGYFATLSFFIIQSLSHYFLVFTRSNDWAWTSDSSTIFSYVKSVSPQYDRIIDTTLHGPLAPYFYGDITTNDIQNGIHSAPDQFGFIYLIKAGKYELIPRDVRDLACEKLGNSDHRKTLVITQKVEEITGVRQFVAYTWNGVDIMHEVYDLDAIIAHQLDHNNSFKGTCSPK